MITLGIYQTLTLSREAPPGVYLSDDEGNEVLLPNRYVQSEWELNTPLEVFVYLDNEERPVATTEKPLITRGGFAKLSCTDVSEFGAFLDWGLTKELFCPFKEQIFPMEAGKSYLVHCYLDEKSGRLVASSRTQKFLDNTELTVAKFDEVEVIISHPSPLGMNVIVNQIHSGLVYTSDLHRRVRIGDVLQGVVKKVHENNKLDIVLNQLGYRNIEPSADQIMTSLQAHDGFLPLTDKSSPEAIKNMLQMSKKSFKKGVGHLYKQRLIRIEQDGIYLVDSE